jgi:hypothetical protein
MMLGGSRPTWRSCRNCFGGRPYRQRGLSACVQNSKAAGPLANRRPCVSPFAPLLGNGYGLRSVWQVHQFLLNSLLRQQSRRGDSAAALLRPHTAFSQPHTTAHYMLLAKNSPPEHRNLARLCCLRARGFCVSHLGLLAPVRHPHLVAGATPVATGTGRIPYSRIGLGAFTEVLARSSAWSANRS